MIALLRLVFSNNSIAVRASGNGLTPYFTPAWLLRRCSSCKAACRRTTMPLQLGHARQAGCSRPTNRPAAASSVQGLRAWHISHALANL